MTLHLHLDPVGGISGDMFAAALLDAFPDLDESLRGDLAAAGLLAHVQVAQSRALANGIAANAFAVTHATDAPHPTHHYRDIRAFLERSSLAGPVRARAIAIFEILADAEAAVHGVTRDEVHFHEIADWDSITDIVAAASLIERCGAQSWTCGSVPLGRGMVKTEHGRLPVPAPATARILEGFSVHDDGELGERATPTGAAILRHLMQNNTENKPVAVLVRSGVGCGSRRFDSLPNILRVLVLDARHGDVHRPLHDAIGVVAFEVDDMTPEELAVALEHLRLCDGVVDVGYQVRFGKKGRAQFAVQVLTEPRAIEAVSDRCFVETSTLGLRLEMGTRRILRRASGTVSAEAGRFAVKRAYRPDGSITAKVESDDLAPLPGHHRRRTVGAAAAASSTEDGDA